MYKWSRIIHSETLEIRKFFDANVWWLVGASASPQAIKVSTSLSFLHESAQPHILVGEVVVLLSCQLCRGGLIGCFCRQGWCFCMCVGWEMVVVGGAQASDGCLMGLGAHIHLSDRFGPRAEAQIWLQSSCYQEKTLSMSKQDCVTAPWVGQYVNELERYDGLCCCVKEHTRRE